MISRLQLQNSLKSAPKNEWANLQEGSEGIITNNWQVEVFIFLCGQLFSHKRITTLATSLFLKKMICYNNIGTISSFLFMIFIANKVLGSQQGTNWVILSVFWSSRSTTLCDTTTSTTTTPSETWSTLKLNFLSKAKKNFLTNEKSFCGRLLMVIQFGLNTLLQNHTTGESLWNLSFQSDSNNSNYGFNETNVSLYLFQNFCFITIKLQMSHSMIYVMGYFKSWF